MITINELRQKEAEAKEAHWDLLREVAEKLSDGWFVNYGSNEGFLTKDGVSYSIYVYDLKHSQSVSHADRKKYKAYALLKNDENLEKAKRELKIEFPRTMTAKERGLDALISAIKTKVISVCDTHMKAIEAQAEVFNVFEQKIRANIAVLIEAVDKAGGNRGAKLYHASYDGNGYNVLRENRIDGLEKVEVYENSATLYMGRTSISLAKARRILEILAE